MQENKLDKSLWTYHQTANSKHLMSGHERQEILLRAIHHISKQGKLLEIGFGDGYLLKKLGLKYQCYGADISEENVKQMQSENSTIAFSVTEVDGKLPYSDEEFDFFVASEVLEHMDDKELNAVRKEIFRVLKRGGHALITVPAKENLNLNECFCPHCGHIFHKWGHKQFWDVQKIQHLFNKGVNLKIKKIIPSSHGLNFFGYVGLFLRRMMLTIGFNIEGSTYLIIFSKK